MSDPSKLSARYTTLVVAAISLIVLSCVAVMVPVPYVRMQPGPAYDTLGDFEGKPMFTFGKNVSHANNKTPRTWLPNLRRVRIVTPSGERMRRLPAWARIETSHPL